MIHSASEPQALNCEETMEDLFNKTLPTEILENVFSFLPHNDLKTVMLVCKKWNEVGESPCLWTWARFRLDLSDFENQAWPDPLGKMEVTRLQAGMLTICDNFETQKNVGGEVAEFLQAALKRPDLKRLCFDCVDLTPVESKLMVEVLTNLEEVTLQATNISCEQSTSLLIALEGETRLRALHLDSANLSEVPPTVLPRAVNKLRELGINGDSLTFDQMDALYRTLARGTRLRKLTLTNSSLFGVDAEVVGKVATQVEELQLVNCGLTRQQGEAIFGAIKVGGKLKVLELKDDCLSKMDPQIMAIGVNRLLRVVLGSTEDQLYHLKNIQMRKILTQSLQRTLLKVLKLGSVDLGYIVNGIWDEELITKAKEVIPNITYSEFQYPSNGQKPIRHYLDPSLKFEL